LQSQMSRNSSLIIIQKVYITASSKKNLKRRWESH
jgi:hypothetical protein